MRRLKKIFVFTTVDHTARRQIVQGIGRFAKLRGDWQASIPWDDLKIWTMPDNANPAGVIAFPQNKRDREFLRGLKIPVVAIGPHCHELGVPRVEWDDEAAGALAVEHFAETGMGAVAIAGSDLGKNYLAGRVRGAQAEAERRGLDFEVFDLEPGGHHPRKAAGAVQRARKWLAKKETPCGIVAASDSDGLTLLAAARAAEIDIPGRLSIVSIGGDNLLCGFSDPSMSSVALPGEEVGFEAARLLKDLIEGNSVENKNIAPRRVEMRRSSDLVVCDDELVNKALRYIREHADTPISISDILTAVPLSRRPLELRFKRKTGRTLQKEIWRVHIARARQLLLETEMPVAEIAYQSGFTEPQRMTEVFVRELGISPGKLRTESKPRFEI